VWRAIHCLSAGYAAKPRSDLSDDEPAQLTVQFESHGVSNPLGDAHRSIFAIWITATHLLLHHRRDGPGGAFDAFRRNDRSLLRRSAPERGVPRRGSSGSSAMVLREPHGRRGVLEVSVSTS
jgi:hypothetical protein